VFAYNKQSQNGIYWHFWPTSSAFLIEIELLDGVAFSQAERFFISVENPKYYKNFHLPVLRSMFNTFPCRSFTRQNGAGKNGKRKNSFSPQIYNTELFVVFVLLFSVVLRSDSCNFHVAFC